MPDALELKGAGGPVVPLVGAGLALVDELVIDRLPGLATVVGALDHLPVPSGGLRRVDAVRVGRRAFDVEDIPSGEVGSLDVPGFTLFVRRQDERALVRPDQHSYSAHAFLLCTHPTNRRQEILPAPPR